MDFVTGSISLPQIPVFLEQKLRRCLPFSLPLYRRCQFHLNESKKSNVGNDKSEIWIAVHKQHGVQAKDRRSADEILASWLEESTFYSDAEHFTGGDPTSSKQHDWLAAHIDLSNPGETQVWLFGSWETKLSSEHPPSQEGSNTISTTRAALFELFYNHVRQTHIPRVSIQPTKRWQSLLDQGKLISIPYRRTKVLFGAVSEVLWPFLRDDIVYERNVEPANFTGHLTVNDAQTCRTRQDLGYLKYIIPPPARNAEPPPPDGFHFSPLSDSHLQLMLDRSAIPRTLELLRSLVSIGLFPNGDKSSEPIAWGMLSKDASLSSLHTEDEYRGRGLAEHVCRKLATLQETVFKSEYNDRVETGDGQTKFDDNAYSTFIHADVSSSNTSSRRVFEKLGGNVRWQVAWIEVDIGETITHNFKTTT